MDKNSYLNQYNNIYSAVLILESGEVFWGQGLGSIRTSIAELCFNTSITGYQEVLTDPSYAKQIITFTFPHIGIVGANDDDHESSQIYASGCVLSEEINNPSNWRAKYSLSKWLKNNNLPCITNVDTRYITKILAKKGAKKAAIVNFGKNKIDIEAIKKQINEWSGLEKLDLAKEVTTKKPFTMNISEWDYIKNQFKKNTINNKSIKIVCIDYGAKRNIFRSLVSKNLEVIVLPANATFEEIINHRPKGIFLSNGPGDPFATGEYAIPVIKKIIDINMPIFGICLGHQILCLALGASTKKMYQGHRGVNHPVKNLETSKVEITSQNHGFEVISKTLPKDVIETHISLFDKTNEGIRHKKRPFFSVQYHPEASPGPYDSKYLFEQFYNNIKKYDKEN